MKIKYAKCNNCENVQAWELETCEKCGQGMPDKVYKVEVLGESLPKPKARTKKEALKSISGFGSFVFWIGIVRVVFYLYVYRQAGKQYGAGVRPDYFALIVPTLITLIFLYCGFRLRKNPTPKLRHAIILFLTSLFLLGSDIYIYAMLGMEDQATPPTALSALSVVLLVYSWRTLSEFDYLSKK